MSQVSTILEDTRSSLCEHLVRFNLNMISLHSPYNDSTRVVIPGATATLAMLYRSAQLVLGVSERLNFRLLLHHWL